MMSRSEPCLGKPLPFPEDLLSTNAAAPVPQRRLARTAVLPLRLWRLARLLFWLIAGVLLSLLLLPFASAQQLGRVRSFWARRVLAACGAGVRVIGTPQQPALWVANHISWVDIIALLAVAQARFVAKSEVARWPIIGWLARCHGTLFLQRGSRAHAALVTDAIAAALAQGETVVLFPEGTTSDGTIVLPFHASLVQAAIAAQRPVQPIALSYWLGTARTTRVAYTGQTTFLTSLLRIIALPSFTAQIAFGPPLDPQGGERKQLALAAHDWVAAQLDSASGQATE